MKISIACPESVRKALTTEDANNHGAADVVTTTIEGALLTFEIAGVTLDDRLQAIRDLDAEIGLAIADEDRPHLIAGLSALKASVGQVLAIVQRESSYTVTTRTEVEEAATDTDISHAHADSNASNADSSEQHGAEPEIEEKEIEQAEQEIADEPAPGRSDRGRRKR